MSKVQKVTVQVRRPKGDDPGQVTTGYFVIEDGVLTMTDGDGFPMRRASGERYEHTLLPTDKPRSIAGVLTRSIRHSIHGENSFNRPLTYPKIGVA